MRKIIGGVISALMGREKVVVEKGEIMGILPHRERMLLLDEVVIISKKISGEFLVTKQVCEGHQFNGQLVFRGIDVLDMAAQLLGIWAARCSEIEGSLAFVRRYGEAKFIGKVVPGDTLIVEINVTEESGNENPQLVISGRPGREIKKIIGENFSARVGKKPKATISSIELIVVDSQSLA